MADLMPAVPKNNPQALVLWESTGEMSGDWWHSEVMRSLDGADDYKLIFLPWFISEEYVMPGHLDKPGPEEEELVFFAQDWIRNNKEHARIAKFEALTQHHLLWRRWMIANEFSGDTAMFQSRYPATIEQAFLAVGNAAIPTEIVRKHHAMIQEPLKYVRFQKNGDEVEAIETVPSDPFVWKLWGDPTEYGEYAIGGDIAEGIISDQQNERSERDFSTAAVEDRKTKKFVATFKGKITPDLFGEELEKCARYFNMAWLAPEINQCGWATITTLKGYPNLMARPGKPDTDREKDLSKLGWKTDAARRNELIDNWITACRGPELTIRDEALVNEERTFVFNKRGKREHRSGCHDDLLFAHMIAHQVDIRCPRNSRGAWMPVEIEERERRPSYAYAGGIDTGTDAEDEQEWTS